MEQPDRVDPDSQSLAAGLHPRAMTAFVMVRLRRGSLREWIRVNK
jgi:hypothetical protein